MKHTAMYNLHIKWRYRCASCALCTAVFVISLMAIHNTPHFNQIQSVFRYQETAYESTEDQMESAKVQLGRHKKTSTKTTNKIRNVVAYSLETQLEMGRRYFKVCPDTLHPPLQSELTIQNTHWQIPLNANIYLYSAFLDNRIQNHSFVRVMAMIQEPNPIQKYYCQIWFGEKPLVVEALVVDMWLSHWDMNPQRNVTKPVLLNCEIHSRPIDTSQVPTGVSVNLNPCQKPSTLLPIKTYENDTINKFTICVKGLDFDTDISDRLIEWFEMNIILGADKFFVYVYNVHEKVSRVLEFYSSKGFVVMIPLTLPPSQRRNDSLSGGVHLPFMHQLWQKRRNEIIPYNDCYYRNLNVSQFVIPLDIDEILLPVRHRTWREMFLELMEEDQRVLEKTSSFSVKNAYFFDIFAEESHEDLHFFKHLTRSLDFSHNEDSVKSFISTTSALSVFNHFTLATLSPAVSRNLLLHPEWMQMNHYKKDCDVRLVPDCRNFRKHRKRDSLMLKYKYELSYRVRDAQRNIRFSSIGMSQFTSSTKNPPVIASSS